MVLCPFVYMITRYEIPPLQLQPSEVAAVHWVPLRVMLSSKMRTYEFCSVSDRLTRPGGWLVKCLLQFMMGKMLYPAIHLVPGESVYCTSAPGFLPNDKLGSRNYICYNSTLAKWVLSKLRSNINKPNPPLLLWGLTHGIMTDFLELLPSYQTLELREWPTLSHWDIRFVLWLVTYRFRREKCYQLGSDKRNSTSIIEEGFATLVESNKFGTESESSSLRNLPNTSSTAQSLNGYHDLVKKAIYIVLILRLGFGSAVLIQILKKNR